MVFVYAAVNILMQVFLLSLSLGHYCFLFCAFHTSSYKLWAYCDMTNHELHESRRMYLFSVFTCDMSYERVASQRCICGHRRLSYISLVLTFDIYRECIELGTLSAHRFLRVWLLTLSCFCRPGKKSFSHITSARV